MFIDFYLPLTLIFLYLFTFLVGIICISKGKDAYYLRLELSRGFIFFSAIEMFLIFVMSYYDESLYLDYNFLFITLGAILVFIFIYFPIIKITPNYDFVDRMFIPIFFSLLSLNTTEFAFFSLFSSPFSPWTVFLGFWALLGIISVTIIIYIKLFTQKEVFFFPFD